MVNGTTLVLGGSGKTGRRVVERLRAKNVAVRVGTREAQPGFDWNARAAWPDVLQDVRAVYVTYYPDLAAPGASDAIRAFTGLAVKSGVQRLVLLSGRGEPEAQLCEEIVRRCAVEWTLVRASWFMQNFSENYLLEPLLAGEVVLPVGNVGEPFIDAEDIADVAVAALTEDDHVGQLYEVTGPRLLSFPDAVAEIGRATVRDIRYVQVSAAEYAAGLDGALPPDVASLVNYLFTEVLDGRNESTTDGVQRALGRPPRDFADFVRDTAASGVWTPKER